MKKTISLLLIFAIFIVSGHSTAAANGDFNELYSISYADKMQLGDEYDQVIVVYDEETKYFNPLYLDIEDVTPYYIVPDDPGPGGAFCYQYFSRIAWVTRNGVVSLALTPKVDTVLYKSRNWESIYALFSDDSQWANSGNPDVDEVMEKQFACHYDGQSAIEPGDDWNLEPHRENYSYLTYLLNSCNP